MATATAPERKVSADEARDVAEAAREQDWTSPSFVRELFLGNFRLDLVHPYPTAAPDDVARARPFLQKLEQLLKTVDSDKIDREGEIPEDVIQRLREIGAFGIKIPREYGGLGLSQLSYMKAIALVTSLDGSITALLSAHQSIGVPQPLKIFGTEEQKQRFLPRLARGAISAFALTENDVGSDPARMTTTAVPTADGSAYMLNGEKLWCTNGSLAELLVVMARNPKTKKISAFVVETDWPGVKVEYRCHFMGLKALANGVISFQDVRVPRDNLIGEEGKGLRIALTTLNTGRLTLPAVCAGIAKQCLKICRGWSNARHQWGVPIWKHEAVAHMIADMAATTFAMDSIWMLASQMADRGGYDIRLEAAAAKEWNTVRAWEIVDKTLQIRGGRGYETAESLAARGERGVPAEQILRDLRINRIFEGSTEIMHLLIAREAVDQHLSVAGDIIDPDADLGRKAKAGAAAAGFYGRWLPTLAAGKGQIKGGYAEYGTLATHVRFVERASRRLARETFYGMARWRGKMERKQAFLGRIVDIGAELFAMTASCVRATAERRPEGTELADLFCRQARLRVRTLFDDLWRNTDDRDVAFARKVTEGRYAFVEEGVVPPPTDGEWVAPWQPGESTAKDVRRRIPAR